MTHCQECGEPIIGKAYPRDITRDGIKERWFLCKKCNDTWDKVASIWAIIFLVVIALIIIFNLR